MENELSALNVIHWECNLSHLNKNVGLNVQQEIGVTGGWLNEIAILQIRWRIMCYVENITAWHFLAEDNYAVPDLPSFNESKMKVTLLNSYKKVNIEIGVRTKEFGNIFTTGVADFPDGTVSLYHATFLQALNAL